MADRRLPRGTDNAGLLLGDLVPGTRVGEFVIESRLGARGTGHIYKATHLVLPRRATIQVLPTPDGPVRSAALELLREACIVDAIDHPGMPRVFETGLLDDRRPWIASELIEGETVADLLHARGVSIAEIVSIVRDVADILAESHRRGLVHGHVAPGAIVIPAELRRYPICLVDWVGARTHDSKAPLPLVVGSRYVAPEQASGAAMNDRSDVFSLGRIGRDLLDGAAGDEIPPMLVALLDSMIAEDPAARPSSASVRNTATWLAAELATEEPDVEPTVRSAPITSELAAEVAGEIHNGEPRPRDSFPEITIDTE
jgi:serine/threonine protein kinase